MNNFTLYLIIVLFLAPFAPFLMWHFRYARLDEKLVELMVAKHPQLWKSITENKFANTLVNYFSFNKSNIAVYIGSMVQVSFNAVGPYAQLRALKFIKSQNIADQELASLVIAMEKTMKNVIFLTITYISLIVLAFFVALGYIYKH